jgi:protein-disulfide isomerase
MALQCFWDFHDVLFRDQWDLGKAGLLAAAETVGLEQGAFQKCLASPDAMTEVQRDIPTARQAGVDGISTYFVNNRRITGSSSLERAIEEALKLNSLKEVAP